jgi:hypothetical protein
LRDLSVTLLLLKINVRSALCNARLSKDKLYASEEAHEENDHAESNQAQRNG